MFGYCTSIVTGMKSSEGIKLWEVCFIFSMWSLKVSKI